MTDSQNTPELRSTTVRNDVAAMSDGQATGCITYWQLSGRVLAPELLTALEDMADIEPKDGPRLATDAEMLRRAVQAVAGRRADVMVDKHPGGGYLLVGRSVDGVEMPTYVGSLRVNVADDEGKLAFEPAEHPLAADIQREYDARQGRFETTEISAWLTKLLDDCKAIRMRPRGGFYYVPAALLEQFRNAVMALRTCSSSEVFEIPAMSSRETAAAIISALRHEVETATHTAQQFAAEGKGGKRACQTQIDNLVAVKDKLQLYAEFMDGSLDDVIGALDSAQVTIAQTLLEKGE